MDTDTLHRYLPLIRRFCFAFLCHMRVFGLENIAWVVQTPCSCFRSPLKLQLTLIGFASLSECVCIQSLLYNLVLEHENVIWCFVQVCRIFSDQLLEIINLLVILDLFIHLPCLNTAAYGTLEKQKYGMHMNVPVGKAIILIQTQH